jgi:hypothetical protein
MVILLIASEPKGDGSRLLPASKNLHKSGGSGPPTNIPGRHRFIDLDQGMK